MTRIGAFARKLRVPALSIFVALFIGALFIIFTDVEVLGRLLSDPIGALSLGVGRAATAYSALLRGALGDPETDRKSVV